MRDAFIVSYALITALGLHQMFIGNFWMGFGLTICGAVGGGMMLWPIKK
jgi:hypothetical protein